MVDRPINLPLVQSYHPATFMDRGVAVPFTTPMLAGTRARPGQRADTELVVPNPSGGRGVYILSWTDLRALCQPTVHDRRLNEKAAGLTVVVPSTIRAAARDVAAEGLAGAAARHAAMSAAEADRRDRLTANYLLLMLLVAQACPDTGAPAGGAGSLHAAPGQRAREAVLLMAARLGQPADGIAVSLEALADVFGYVGVPGVAGEFRIPRLLGTLRRVRGEVSAWRAGRGDSSSVECAEIVVSAADLTLACAEKTLAEARALTADIAGLLRGWQTSPSGISDVASRPDWLLDGWEQICALWDDASDPGARLSALVEMALLVPILPNETVEWIGMAAGSEPLTGYRRMVQLNEDWRTGTAVFSLIARNERLRALAP